MTASTLPPAAQPDWRRVAVASALGLVILVTLEFTRIDLALARLAWDAQSRTFPLRNHTLTALVSHDGARLLAGAAFAWVVVGVWKPLGALARLATAARVRLALSVIACLVVVGSLKRASALHCPWGLAEVGGSHPYLRLFEPVPPGWSRGACFPAGHALSAFAFIGGYFAWCGVDRRIARRWLLAVLAAGGWIGLTQQLRGAHFLSHTLWTLWICWTLAAALHWLAGRLWSVKPAAGPAR